MAVYQFSALSDGQAISFNPDADVLNFDQSLISAADLRATAEGTSIRVSASSKEVFLLASQLAQLTTTNVTFANGSVLLFGDNTTAQTADNSGNSLTGSSGNDHLWGFGGNDSLNGGTGNDWLAGGTGQDNIAGGAGADSIVFRETASNNNFDRVSGFVSGEDRLMFHEDVFGDVTLPGRIVYNTSNGYLYFDADGSGAGRAQLVAILQGAPTLAAGDIGTFDDETTGGGGGGATEGNDTLVGTPGNDSIDGLGGDDLIQTLGGNDTLVGGAGADTLEGGDGNDTYELPRNGVDTIRDTSGTDVAVMHGDVAILAEGSGVENLIIVGAPDAFDVATGRGNELDNFILNDSDFGFAWLSGQGGDDTIVGKNNGSDEFGFFAPGGDYGNDTVDGGESAGFENDLLDFRGTVTGVVVDFRSGMATGGGPGGSGSVAFTRIESAIGGAHGDRLIADDSGQMNWMMGYLGNDTLIGGAADDNLEGDSEWSDHEPTQQGGSDQLFGNGGNDNLRGWAESDSLNGGAGNDELDGDEQFAFTDAFIFDQPAGASNADIIMDFGYGGVRDELHLDNSVMSALGAAGRFSAADARFFAGAGANSGQDASDRVVYDTTTGQLWYDADGSGAGTALLVATLQGAPTVQATDIVVIGDGGPAPIVGTEGDDSLTGTAGADTIDGLGGNDTIDGGDGRDLIQGGEGNDSLIGGQFGNEGDLDTLEGGTGNDVYDIFTLGGTATGLVLLDSGGMDTVIATSWTLGAGFENLTLRGGFSEGGTGVGNELDNLIRVESVSDDAFQVHGNDGNDTLVGGEGTEEMHGGEGNDWLDGGIDVMEVDLMSGDAGEDSFVFRAPPPESAFADRVLDFSSSVDALVVDNNGFAAVGGAGAFAPNDARFAANASGTAMDATDRVIYNTSTGELWYDADGTGAEAAVIFARLEGTPTVASTDIVVIGSGSGGQTIGGTEGNDSIRGTGGNDTMNGFGGDDDLNGEAGDDSISGGAGRDTLSGGGGDDWLEGGTGQDSVTGGEGADSFVFRETPFNSNFERILDFESGIDMLGFDEAVYAALGGPGEFSADDDRFFAAAGARSGVDAEDRLIYNTSTGVLWYDADGSGPGGQLFVATLQGAPALAASDIAVI